MSDMDWNKYLLDKIAAQDKTIESQAAQIAEKDAEVARCKSSIAMLMADALDAEALRADAERLKQLLQACMTAMQCSRFPLDWAVMITATDAALRQEQPKGEGA